MHRHFTSVSSRLRNHALFPQREEAKFTGRLRKGDATSWIQLVNQWSPRLYSYVSYNVENEAETRKLLRTILSDVVHTLLDTPQTPNLTIVIFSIAYHHVLHYRGQTSTAPRPNRQPTAAATDSAMSQGMQFIESFRQFSPEIQQILLLRYLCGVTLPELSQITGQSEERLNYTIYRAERYLL